MVEVLLTLVQRVPDSIAGCVKNSVSITASSITASDHGAGAVDDNDLIVSSDQGNTPIGLP